MGQSVLTAKHDSRALVQGKKVQCVHKIMSQTGIDSLRIVLRLQQLLVHADKLFAFARILAKTVVSDSVKPCGKSRFAAKAPDVLVSANKGFLPEIIGQGNVCACELSKQAAHIGLMPPHQLAKRVLIVIDKNSRDKVRISELHGLNITVPAEEEECSFCLPISISRDSRGRSETE